MSGALALLAATAGWSSDYGTASPAARPAVTHQYRQGGLRLPHELKVMWRKEERGRLKTMPRDERRGWLKRQWADMTDRQKHAKLAELQKKWDALPQDVRQHLIEKRESRREAHRVQHQKGDVTQPQDPGPAMHRG